MVDRTKIENAALIVGLGRTGGAARRFFERLGRPYLLYDDRRMDCLHSPNAVDWTAVDCLVLSPGIPFDHPVVQVARAQGLKIWSDIDLFVQEVRDHVSLATFIGVTGTNGKSTTTALIGHLLKRHFPKVIVGGNIGNPVLDLPLCNATYVLELSSFQLAWSHSLSLDVAIWTNLTEDHLDRHGSMAAYALAKQKIFNDARWSAMGVDDVPSQKVFRELRGQGILVKSVSVEGPADYQVRSDGVLLEDQHPIFNIQKVSSLPGAHNAQNIALAAAAVHRRGMSFEEIAAGLATFKGLAHRIETVRATVDGVELVNDSKATNAASTIKALESFQDAALYLIAGGRAKSDGLTPAIPFMKNVKKIFLIGEASERFACELQAAPKAPPFEFCVDLETALTRAVKSAQQDRAARRVILFSPACASFDQFSSFEERGDAFRQLSMSLNF